MYVILGGIYQNLNSGNFVKVFDACDNIIWVRFGEYVDGVFIGGVTVCSFRTSEFFPLWRLVG